jgi:DNA mismatch repair protein MutS
MAATPQMPLFQSSGEQPLRDALETIDPDNLTPREALQTLYILKEMLHQDLHS